MRGEPMFQTLTIQAAEFRAGLLLTTTQHLIEFIQHPAKGEREGANALAMAEAALTACEAVCKVPTKSTDAYYAERDLPDNDREHLTSARHYLTVLRALYGPKEAS